MMPPNTDQTQSSAMIASTSDAMPSPFLGPANGGG
jgi:hypothetical protein